MLEKLSIRNYAIIDELELQFDRELTIITGETGAGKSILMGALSLILGERADTSVLMNRENKSVVEGYFSVGAYPKILEFLKKGDLDVEPHLVIRREISAQGKSRAFVNDTPVNLEQLRQLGALLVDLHRQYDTLELGESGFQREVMDALANQGDVLETYQQHYRLWKEARQVFEQLNTQKLEFTKNYDYHKFLYDELEEAAFKPQELEDADAELKLLSNLEGITAALTQVTDALGSGESPMVNQCKILASHLQPYTQLHPELPALIQRMLSLQIELKDILSDAEKISDRLQYNPGRIQELNDRISIGYKLQKKHNVHSTAELLALKEELFQKLQAVLDIDSSLQQAELEVVRQWEQLQQLAGRLSENRVRQIKPFETKVNTLLVQVGMPNARIRVQHSLVELNEFGKDRMEFLFDANQSQRFEPLSKVASGGELSRLMLCIKSLVARSLDLPTLIFDEIDSGISGEAAKQVGVIMKSLSAQRQVICITHQPQIAGKANRHLFVYKEKKGAAVQTRVRALAQEERVKIIAQMLGGEKPTAAALQNAREMVAKA